MAELTLYQMPSSGNSYKVRLMLGLLGQAYTTVDLEQDSPALAAAHEKRTLPLGKLPVLEFRDGTRLPESNAILCFLADGTPWLPTDRLPRARVLAWMFFEQNRHEPTIAVRAALRTYASRAHLATPERMSQLLDAGHAALQVMEDRLADRDWLEGDRATVADISLYAYTANAGAKGGFEMARFPAVERWLNRVETLSGWVAA